MRILKLLAVILIVKIIATVLLSYRDYLPPDFETTFLLGRQHYFFGAYSWAFYAHIVAGPCSLGLGLILLSGRFRQRFSKWHRRLGRVQVASVVLLVAPSGLWMAFYAETGAIAGLGFAALAIATAGCALLGWRSAVRRQFNTHRRWMERCYVLLCSAVVIRMIGGFATAAAVDATWLYPLSAWASWLLPLAIFELSRLATKRSPVTR